MAREIMVIEAPMQDPHICAKCGVGAGDRPYFVDLGIDSEFSIKNKETNFPHYTLGVVYFCSECIQNTFSELNRQIFQFIKRRSVSLLNEAAEKQQALDIQLQENAHLKGKLDELYKELEASKALFKATFEDRVYAELEHREPTGQEVIEALLGKDENGTDGNNSDAEGTDSGSEGSDPESEPDNSSPPVNPNTISIDLGAFGT